MNRRARGVTRAATIASAALLASACTSGTDVAPGTFVAAFPLVDDLCTLIPADLRERWALTDVEHSLTPATPGGGRVEQRAATCTARGAYDGRPIAVSLSVTSMSASSMEESYRQRIDAVDVACAALEARSLVAESSDGGDPLRRPTFTWERPTDLDRGSCTLSLAGGSRTEIRDSSGIRGPEIIEVAYDPAPGQPEDQQRLTASVIASEVSGLSLTLTGNGELRGD